MLENIKGAIFDMDGTLVDSLMLWDVIWEEFGLIYLGKKGFRLSDEDNKAIRTMTLAEAMQYIHKRYSIGADADELVEKANGIIEHFYSNEVEVKEGVREFLDCCKANGVEMCIASATEKRLVEIAVEHCKLSQYFPHILSCADIGKGKEEPDVYLKALECIGTQKEETCVFEDSLIAIQTAHKLGLKTVGIYDKYNYGHDEMEKLSTAYIGIGETLKKLIKEEK